MKTEIFNDFEPLSKEQWTAQATRDLRGKDFDQTLVSKTEDGLVIHPYYALEDLDLAKTFRPFRQQIQSEQPIVGLSPRYWSNLHLVGSTEEKEENKKIRYALNNGADGLILELTGDENLDVLLDGVVFEYIVVFLKIKNEISAAINFFEWCRSKNVEKLFGGLQWDPITAVLHTKANKEKILGDMLLLLEAVESYPEFKVFCVDGAYLHNTGATGILELKYGLGAYIELLDLLTENGLDVATLFKKTMILTAAGSDYFYEIAKIRSYKLIMVWLAHKYDVHLDPKEVYISAETSSWTKTLLDIPTNMLRNTTEAMACILGGCEALYIRPHDFIATNMVGYSERIARNVSNVLLEEAYFGKVLDPVAGCYYLETLIHQITENVKLSLIELEDKGGWWSAYDSGEIQSEIKSISRQRKDAILNQEQIKVGVNKYEEKSQALSEVQIPQEEDWQLLPSRATELFESQKTLKA